MKHASLNCACRLVWSDVHSAYIAVAENVKARDKKNSKALTLVAAGVLTGAAGCAVAANLPAGGQVMAGSGSIATMTVTQSTARMAA